VTPQPPFQIFTGWDVREDRACNVAQYSLRARTVKDVDPHRIVLANLQARGVYCRPTSYPEHCAYFDEISQAPMSTSHAISRFLVPALCGYEGWALFTDGDVLYRRDVAHLFALADPTKAVQVVQHDYAPTDVVKMDGQVQMRYARKNWSSVMLFHCGHPANRALSVDLVNTVPGRDLHAFCWLDDALIGALPVEWNYLVGHSSRTIDPAIVHFTTGVPDMPGFEHVEYADEWYRYAKACGYRLHRPAKAQEAVA
jgi:hypothetical protein